MYKQCTNNKSMYEEMGKIKLFRYLQVKKKDQNYFLFNLNFGIN